MIPKIEELHKQRSEIDKQIAIAYKEEGYGIKPKQIEQYLLEHGFKKSYGKFYKSKLRVTLMKTAFRVDRKMDEPILHTVFGNTYEIWYQRLTGAFYTRLRFEDLDNFINWEV